MEFDLLYDAAINYGKLNNIGYHIILGRRGKSYTLDIYFPHEAFYHLAGLQHLKDLTFPSHNKERIYKDICNKKITYDNLKRSEFFDKCFIQDRLTYLPSLEEMLDNVSLIFRINLNNYL
ncbi:PBECR4 domain-containing protein [Lachnospiraceae bacterium 54-53]